MSFKKFLISKDFFKNLGLAIAIGMAVVFLTLIFLSIYTRHGQSRPVPDFYGLTIDEAAKLAKKKRLRYQVIDSVYTNAVPRGCIVEQNPVKGFGVKKDRRIVLTINAFNPEMVIMPDLMQLSKRQALAVLESSGLEIGKLKYKPDLAVDYVLEQLYHDQAIEAGDSVQKGSVIDLVLGRGLSDQRTDIPDLMGMTMDQAINRILGASLNIGTYSFDKTIENQEDSLNAFVYKQNPVYNEDATLQLGSPVYLWLTTDSLKLPSDTLTIDTADSLLPEVSDESIMLL